VKWHTIPPVVGGVAEVVVDTTAGAIDLVPL
jgi:hypothetical protein